MKVMLKENIIHTAYTLCLEGFITKEQFIVFKEILKSCGWYEVDPVNIIPGCTCYKGDPYGNK